MKGGGKERRTKARKEEREEGRRRGRKEGRKEGRREDRLTTPNARTDRAFTSICFALFTDLRVT